MVKGQYPCFPNIMLGKVVWFNVKNGYGFIRGQDDHVDYFAHFSKIIADPGHFRLLNKGDTVDFKAMEADRGNGQSKPQATQIKILEGGDTDEVLGANSDRDFGGRDERPAKYSV